jgi:isopentenyl diphosphate isomerase/L-lactate dehydrogenase-like FMN-dependent dehydrogenase
VKCLALGADAVLTGRATLYGVAAGGEKGASKALTILMNEMKEIHRKKVNERETKLKNISINYATNL